MSFDNAPHQISVPDAWRASLREVVNAFVQGDFGLDRGVVGVIPIPADLAVRNAGFVASYGEELVELPDETWATSCCARYGEHWDILVDLWTRREGRSDMVLAIKVLSVSAGEGPFMQVGPIYVP